MTALSGWWSVESGKEVTQRQIEQMRAALEDATAKGKTVLVVDGVRLVWHPAPDSLDAAWAEADAALPEGWAVNLLWGTTTEDRWGASAGPFPSKPGDRHEVARGSTPAAALHALAVKLREVR